MYKKNKKQLTRASLVGQPWIRLCGCGRRECRDKVAVCSEYSTYLEPNKQILDPRLVGLVSEKKRQSKNN